MLAGFLTVLKIIGIVLLVILAVLLVLILLVLFVPIAYRMDAGVPETKMSDGFDVNRISASAKFSWLWFVLRGAFEFPGDKTFTVRVFGIKVFPKKPKADKDKSKDKAAKDEKEVAGTEEKADETPKTEGADTGSEQTTDIAAETSSESETGADDTLSTAPGDESKKDEWDKDEDESKSFLDVLWKIIDTVGNILKTPLDVLEKIQCTISRVCGKIDMIKSTLENDIFKRAFELVKKRFIKVMKMLIPDKCDIRILYGNEDPSITADFMGVYGILYPLLYRKVEFTPDFERDVLKTEAHIKGHVTLFTIVYSAAICFFNKDVRKTVNRFKKIIKS